PWQLPPAGPLIGRTAELDGLERRRQRVNGAGHAFLAALSGLGGVGKTTVALAWLHALRREFPDGQLYADLGARAGAGPADPGEVLSRFLRGLGVPGPRVPPGIEERGALYRSLTAQRRLVVLLDDAASAAQVRHLLLGGPNVTAVTSRRRLPGLAVDGCYAVGLEPLATEAAVELLARTLDDGRVAAQAEEARTLVRLCAGLPLAVRVAGARLAGHPGRPLTAMVRALTAERDRLEVLAIEDDHSVRAALDLSYQGLPAGAARLYRLLGLHPGRDFGSGTAAAALGLAAPRAPQALELLDALHDANLLTAAATTTVGGTGTGAGAGTEDERYRFHDLVRLHAAACAARDEPEGERAAAVRRITDHYLASATRAEELTDPQHRTLARSFGPGPVVTAELDEGSALDWLERELPNLMAVQRCARDAGNHPAVWQLADALWPLFLRRKHYEHWHAAHREGLAAARELGDTAAECRMLTSGGLGELGRGEAARALEMFERAAEVFRSDGDTLGATRTLNYRGLACQALGRAADAAGLFARAAAELPGCGDPRAAGLARLNLADASLAAGSAGAAAGEAEAARAVLTQEGDRYNAARAALLHGRALLALERLTDAEERLEEALAVLRDAAADYESGRALESLAELAERRGLRSVARERYERALAAYAAVGAPEPPEAESVRARLARLPPEG
ncbi:ATP-binding protein, partial [Streptomyces boncukensis]